MANTKLNEWADQVIVNLKKLDEKLFRAAIASWQEEYDSAAPDGGLELLEWM